MLYDTLTEFCTETSCPIMSAGSKYEYMWEDVRKDKKVKAQTPAVILLITLTEILIVYFI